MMLEPADGWRWNDIVSQW